MAFLPLVCFRLGVDRVLQQEECLELWRVVKLTDADMNTTNFKPGSTGEAALKQRLMNATGITEKEAWRGVKT